MATPAASTSLGSLWAKNRGLLFPLLISASVLVIIAPLPPSVMDLLLSANVTLAVVILLTTIYVTRPLDFSVFPSLLLGTTLARLVLNVASTRLILTRGAIDREAAAGGVIQAFGEFVAGGQIVVGLVIFAILIAIQFLVITKGASRISEVAARFFLDGMPGKQMAIDADLNAGNINAAQAKIRRDEVAQQADFYGAMDGASKFVRGDAIAGIVITVINIVGGIYIGVIENGMTIGEAGLVFTKLTIGDGLVTQIPAFLISLASGLLVTRSSSNSDLSSDIINQTFVHPEALGLSGVFVAALSFTGLPRLPLMVLSIALAVGAYFGSQRRKAKHKQVEEQKRVEAAPPAPEAKPEDSLGIDSISLEVGLGLLSLADENKGGQLLPRIKLMRQKIAQEIGMIVPPIRVKDNLRLDERRYEIKIFDVPVASGNLFAEGLLAVDTGVTSGEVPGIKTTDPTFGSPAVWIDPSQRLQAELYGYILAEPTDVLVLHLTETLRKHSDELLSHQQVHHLIEHVRAKSPKLVEELVPEVLRIAQIHQVLTNLLRERVPIRQLESILEALGLYADRTKDLGILTEYVRYALSRTICQQYRDADRTLYAVSLDPALEDIIAAGIQHTERGSHLVLSPQMSEAIAKGIKKHVQPLVDQGRHAVVVCSPHIRSTVRQITAPTIPQLAVLALNEITKDTHLEGISQVGLEVLPSIRERSGGQAPQLAGAR